MPEARARARALAVFALIAATTLTMLPPAALASHTSRLEQTRREIRATRARLTSMMRNEAQLRAALAAVNRQLAVQQSALSVARATLAKVDLKIRAQERRIAELDRRQAARKRVINTRARAMYIMGPANSIEALTDAQTLEEFAGRAGALEFVMSFDKRWIEELRAVEDEARKARAQLRVERAAALEARNEVAARVEVVEEIVEAREDTHAALEGKVDALRGELAALQREQNRILALIRSRQSRSTGPISRSGFVWPIRGMITSPYGPRWGGFHTGMDIDCRTGDRIVASKAGRVIASEWGGGYGNMVVIDHGNGVSTLYAHNSRLYVRRGQRVAQRQAISACGNTGNSSGDHLHFEVRINGRHTNPRPYLP